jgi:hypothetical protein
LGLFMHERNTKFRMFRGADAKFRDQVFRV